MNSANNTVALILPPLVLDFGAPYLSPGLLVAYLRKHGISAQSYDLNIRLFHWLAKPDGEIEREFRAIAKEYEDLQKNGKRSQQDIAKLTEIISQISHAPCAALKDVLAAGTFRSSEPTVSSSNDFQWKDFFFDVFLGKNRYVTNMNLSSYLEITKTGNYIAGLIRRFIAAEGVLPLIEEISSAQIVGFSVSHSQQLVPAFIIARKIREINPKAKIVFGGAQLALASDQDRAMIAQLDFIDALVLYEGEQPLLHMAISAASSKGWDLLDIRNTMFRDSDGKIRSTDIVQGIDLDELPTPEYNDDEIALYDWTYPLFDDTGSGYGRYLNVYVTRGCYWAKCHFCEYPSLYTSYGIRSPEKVIEDIKSLASRYRIFNFWLTSEALPVDWTRQFVALVEKEKIQCRMGSFVRPEGIEVWQPGLAFAMKRAGFEHLGIGAETTSDRLLSVINKGVTMRQVFDTFDCFHAAGIRTMYNIIFGIPTTTIQEFRDAMLVLKENADTINMAGIQRFDLGANSNMARRPSDFGLAITDEKSVFDGRGIQSLGFRRLSGASNEEITASRSLLKKTMREFILHSLTKENRCLIQSPEFVWRKASFTFKPLYVFNSRLSTRSKNPVEEVLIVSTIIGHGPYKFLRIMEFPAIFDSLLQLILEQKGMPIAFDDLVEAFRLAHRLSANKNTTFRGEFAHEYNCRLFLSRMVAENIVTHIHGGIFPKFSSEFESPFEHVGSILR